MKLRENKRRDQLRRRGEKARQGKGREGKARGKEKKPNNQRYPMNENKKKNKILTFNLSVYLYEFISNNISYL